MENHFEEAFDRTTSSQKSQKNLQNWSQNGQKMRKKHGVEKQLIFDQFFTKNDPFPTSRGALFLQKVVRGLCFLMFGADFFGDAVSDMFFEVLGDVPDPILDVFWQIFHDFR